MLKLFKNFFERKKRLPEELKKLEPEGGQKQEVEKQELSREEQIKNLGDEAEARQQEITRLSELIERTRANLNEAREKLGLPPVEEDPPSVFSEKDKLEKLQAEQEALEKQKEELVNNRQEKKEPVREEEKELEEKIGKGSQQSVVLDPKSVLEQEQSQLEAPDEIILRSFEKERSNSLGGGCNTSVFVKLKDDDSGVFKPKNGESENLRKCVKAGTYFNRERAAYLVDKFLGFGLVPPTVIREIDDEIGSFQRFVSDSQTGAAISSDELVGGDVLRQQLIKLWFFDYIIYNSDRHTGNFLVKFAENKIYAIDNGLSFGNDYTQFCKEFFDVPISPEIAEGIEKFLSWKEGREICADLLRELLSSDEVEACMNRIEKISRIIKQHGRIPEDAQGELTF